MEQDFKAMVKVHSLREKKLSFREIARIMKKDVKTVYRWYKYPLLIANRRSRISKGDK